MQYDHKSNNGRGYDDDLDAGSEVGVSTAEKADAPTLSDDDVFEVLCNRRRRLVVEYLLKGDGTVTAGDLAEYIAAVENGVTLQAVSSSDRKSVYVSLYQTHLPLLDDVNVVDYDDGRKRVHPLETVTQLEPYLGGETEPVHGRTSAAVAAGVSASVLLGSFQIGVFAVAPVSAWTSLGIICLVGLVCLDMYLYGRLSSRTHGD